MRVVSRWGFGVLLAVLSCAWACGSSRKGPGATAVGGDGGVGGANDGGQPTVSGGAGGVAASGTGATGDGGTADFPGGAGGAESTNEGCSPVEARYCDDGNDCTTDSCRDHLCVHEAVADGSACNDADVCTNQDTCTAGRCGGAPVKSTAALLGEAVSFGTYEERELFRLQHLVVALTDQALVFAEDTATGLELKLVQLTDGQPTLVDRISSYAKLDVELGEYADEPGTHLVRLSPTRVALVSSAYLIELFDVADGKLSRGAYRSLTNDGVVGRLADVAGSDDQLWLDDGQDLYLYEVAANGTLQASTHVTNSSPFPRIALADSGDVLYVAGARGVFTFDISDRTKPVPNLTPVIPGNAPWQPTELAVRSGYLWLQTVGPLGETGAGRLFTISNYEEVFTLPGGAGQTRLGLGAALGEDQLLLQQLALGSSGATAFIAALYDLDGASVSLRSELSYRSLERFPGRLWKTYPPELLGDLAVLEPTAQLLDVSGPQLRAITGPDQGALDNVRYEGASRLSTYASDATHLLDLSSPAAPKLIQGGSLPLGQPSSEQVALSSPTAPAALVGRYMGASSLLARFSSSQSLAPQLADELSVSSSQLVMAEASDRGLLFRLTADASDPMHGQLEVVDLDAVTSNAQVKPLETFALPPEMLPLSGPRLAADLSGSSLVVVDLDLDREGHGTVSWLSRATGTWELQSQLELDVTPTSGPLLVSPDRAAIAVKETFGLVLIERSKEGKLSVAKTRDYTIPDTDTLGVAELLGVDGNRLYASAGLADPELGARPGVVVYDTTELTELGVYLVPQTAKSLSAAGDLLTFGSRDRVMTASPGCN